MTCLDIANTDTWHKAEEQIKHHEDSISLLDINDDSLLDIESSRQYEAYRHKPRQYEAIRGTSRGKPRQYEAQAEAIRAEEQMDTTDTRHKAFEACRHKPRQYEAEKETCSESSEADQSLVNKYRPLVEVLCEFNKCRIYGLKRALRKRKMENLEFLTQRHVSIMTTYETKFVGRICVDPHAFTTKGARYTMALGKHRSKTSVESYFMVKRKITLKYGFLPCIVVRLGNTSRYYPLEVLEILIP